MAKANNDVKFSTEEKRYVTQLINDASNQRTNQYKYIGLLTLTRYQKFSKAGKLVGEKSAPVFHGPQANSISNYMKKSIIDFMVAQGYTAKVETYVSKCFSDLNRKAEVLNMSVKNGGKHKVLDYEKIKNAIDPADGKPQIIIDITSDKKTTVKGDPKKYAGTVASKSYTLNETTGEIVTDKDNNPVVKKVTDNVTSADKVTNVASANKYIAHWEAQAVNATNKVVAMQARLKKDARGAVRLTK